MDYEILVKSLNPSVETNRRGASPLSIRREFGAASCAPPSLSAPVAHLLR